MRSRPRGLAAAFAVLAVGLGLSAPSAGADPALPAGFQDQIAIGGLEQPVNFRFAPDGRVFVAEKPGKILVFENIEDTTPEVFADLRTDVYETGDRGLLGLAIDPKFDEGRPYVYALYTYDHILGDPEPPPKWGAPETTGDPCPDYNGGDACLVSGRLVRLEAEGDHAKESGGEVLQQVLAEDWCQQFSSHSIGDLRFGPEGDLYVSGGDGASFTSADYGQLGTEPNPCGDPPGAKGTALSPPDSEGGSLRAQNLENLSGKILRVNPDTGAGVAGNPLFGSEAGEGEAAENEARIVADGFRNPFRFTFDPESDELITDNVGSSEIEEIDRFPTPPTALYNSGWPCYEGPERQFQFRVLGLDVCEALYEAEENGEARTSEPFFYYSHGQSVVPGDECPIEYGSALGGISIYDGEEFPSEYKGALFFTDTVRGCVWTIFHGSDGELDPSTARLFMRENRIYPAVDIEQGPEGGLYYADLFGNEEFAAGAIHRITYEPGAPTAKLSANPPYGTSLPLHVTFDASESSDPEGETLTYEWDMDGNGTFETGGGATEELTFTAEELEEEEEDEETLNHVVGVRVSDESGHSSVARVTVYPGDSPPQPEIDSPSESTKWGVGDELRLEGSATIYNPETDSQEPLYEPLGYNWSTRLLHCPTGPTTCHSHPLELFAGTREGEFQAPEHDYPSYIEITLRVADHRGLSTSKTIKLEPRAVTATIASSPPGVEITAGLLQDPAPYPLTSVEGSHVLLTAPETFVSGNKTYAFSGWSDGGARIHTILAEDATTEYKAEYEAPEAKLAPPTQRWSSAGELEVEFDASGSTGEGLEYEWDPQGDGSFEAAGDESTKSISVGDESPHTVAVRVTDSSGASDIAEETIDPVGLTLESNPSGLPLEAAGVSKASPFTLYALEGSEVEISAPKYGESSGVAYRFTSWADGGGRTRTVQPTSAAAYTAEYAEYTPPKARLAEPTQRWNGAGELEVEFDASGSTGEGLEYEWDPEGDGGFEAAGDESTKSISVGDESPHTVAVRVTDSSGASDIAEETIDPVGLTLESNPSGLPLEAAGISKASPFTLYALEGSEVEISAPASAFLGGDGYTWNAWSDDKSRTHTVVTDEPAAYKATYAADDTEPPPTEGSSPAETPTTMEAPPALPSATGPTARPHLRARFRKHPPKKTHSGRAAFAFTANLPGVHFRCKLDHGRLKPCPGRRIVYKHLRRGHHVFQLLAIGKGGHPRALRTYRWRVL